MKKTAPTEVGGCMVEGGQEAILEILAKCLARRAPGSVEQARGLAAQHEPESVHEAATQAGFVVYSDVQKFKAYVLHEVLALA